MGKNNILLYEFEEYLSKKYKGFKKEVVFKHIMETHRMFRADYYLPDERIIIEINGGQYVYGRHNRGGAGYENDLRKMNIAVKNGFRYYQFTYQQLSKQEYLEFI